MRTTLTRSRSTSTLRRMQNWNWMLAAELERMRRDEIHGELAHERFLASHGLDLWSVLRRAIAGRLRLRYRVAVRPSILRRWLARSPSAAVRRAAAREL